MPSNITSPMFFYTYVLRSLSDMNYYVGYTNNLRRRLEEHNTGKSFSTKGRAPFKLVYFEACLDIDDAKQRETYLKNTIGRRYLGKRLHNYNRQLLKIFA